MLTKVVIERSGKQESYVMYDSGLLINDDGSFTSSDVVKPDEKLWNRMVTVNERVRSILGLNVDHIKKL